MDILEEVDGGGQKFRRSAIGQIGEATRINRAAGRPFRQNVPESQRERRAVARKISNPELAPYPTGNAFGQLALDDLF